MKTLRTLATVAATGAILALVPVGTAMAANTGETAATFSLAGGTIDVTAAPSAALSNASTGAGSVTGLLGTVAVSDTRGTTVGWVVTAASTPFTDGAGSDSTSVSYNSNTVASTGIVTAGSEGATLIDTAANVVVGTDVSGNNTASYAPSLTVALPASALVGDYTGTVTTSIS
ncbi:MAG: putative secreted protein [Marmoricola sp.]|nr:putative secreted protein [Marmoricola sp.]